MEERGASMPEVVYRQAEISDVPALARCRAAEWGDEEYWQVRIAGYLAGEIHPRQALPARIVFVAQDGESDTLVGFVAAHLTRRYECDGELEWINVVPAFRGQGIAADLLAKAAGWFAAMNASRICVDVDPANTIARRFYERHGAETLNAHWLVWPDIRRVLAARLR
jgi:ribosomal protein S18 acetylase RimI-like enzyme